jgi:hypothetical protein
MVSNSLQLRDQRDKTRRRIGGYQDHDEWPQLVKIQLTRNPLLRTFKKVKTSCRAGQLIAEVVRKSA